MASLATESNGSRRIQFFDRDRKRQSVRLGQVPKKVAEEIRRHVEHLTLSQCKNIPLAQISPDTDGWVRGIDLKMANKLARAGLIEPPGAGPKAVPVGLDAFI